MSEDQPAGTSIPSIDDVLPEWERPKGLRGKAGAAERHAIEQINAARANVQALLIDRINRLETDNDRLRRTAERTDGILAEQANHKRRLNDELEQARLSFRRAEVVTALTPLVLTVVGQICAITGRRITGVPWVGYEKEPTVSYYVGEIRVVHRTGSSEVVIDADSDEAMTYTLTTSGLSERQITAITAYFTDDKKGDKDDATGATDESATNVLFGWLLGPNCGRAACPIHGTGGPLSYKRAKMSSFPYSDFLRDVMSSFGQNPYEEPSPYEETPKYFLRDH